MKDGKSSPIIVLPILILLIVAGGAALVGTALSGNHDDETVAAEPLLPNPDLGPTCTELAGPRPDSAVDQRVRRQVVATCVENRIKGISYDAQGEPQGRKPVSGADGLLGVSVEGFGSDVVVVRWAGETPDVVLDRVGQTPEDVLVTFVAAG